MSFSFNYPKRPAFKAFAACCLGFALTGAASQRSLGGSIEFSDPTAPVIGTNLSLLLQKSELPEANNSSRTLGGSKLPNSSLRPIPQSRVVSPGSKNWVLMSPDEMMQSIIQRDILKTPQGANGPEISSAMASFNFRRDSGTNQFGASGWGGNFGDTNRLSKPDVFKEYDPFGSPYKRNSQNAQNSLQDWLWTSRKSESVWDFFRKPDDDSPEAVQARKAQVERIEAFKKLLAPSAIASPAVAAVTAPQPSTGFPGLNGFGTDPANSFNPAAAPVAILTGPSIPTPPKTPIAPGQSPLPAYTP